jgi:hypothetical protein
MIRAIANEQIAGLMRAMNPVRMQYTLFADSNPFMKAVAGAADKVRTQRRPAAASNVFLQMQEQMADAIVAGWNASRELRDKMQEQTFYSIYNSPILQAMVGTGGGVAKPPHPPAKTPEERAAIIARLASYHAEIAKGGPVEAKFRALLYVLAADRALDERSAFALRKAAPELAELSVDEVKRIVREQFFALLLDREHALRMLPSMVPADDQRKTLLTELRAILDVAGSPTPEMTRRLAHVAASLEQRPARPQPVAVPQPAAKVEPERKRPAPVG